MRPLRLEIEGFTSFRERSVLDFDGLDLFAITGPTGAGKSSLIDALVFALYGQVPRVGKEYRQLLSHGAERASVRLDFAVGDERYRVVRTIRASGPAPSRLERVRPGTPEKTHGLADRVSEIEKQVERIVGLDYDAFTRSVVLPQGQFDAFLKGEPEERRKILVALLNLHVYKRMQEAANRRANDARCEGEFIAGQLTGDFAGAMPEALAAKRRAVAEAEKARDAAEATLETLGKVTEAAQGVRAARRETETLERELRDADAALRNAEASPGELRQRKDTLTREKQAVEERLSTLSCDETRLRSLLDARPAARRLADLLPKRRRLEEAAGRLADALGSHRLEAKAAEKKVAPADKAVAKARQQVDEARGEREALHRQHAAHELRRALKPGDPCPVCTQPVVLLPPAAAPALEKADASLAAAERELAKAQRAESDAQLQAERAKGQVEKLESEVEQARRLCADADEELAKLRPGLADARFSDRALGDPAGVVRAIETELAGLEKARAERTKAEEMRRRVDEDLAGLSARIAAADAQIASLRDQAEAIQRRHAEGQARLREATEGLRKLCSRSGLSLAVTDRRDEADAAEAIRSATHAEHSTHAAAAGRLEAEAAELERRIARATELLEKKKTLDASAALSLALAQHLRADQFLAYVLEEALRRLAADGSRHLKQLSQGRYSLQCEGQEFFVLDHWNADAVRSVKTLSGGETFLASLGLAIALAESLASLSAEDRAGDALESLFLDEGFGTLDPETLAQVVQAIEQLQGGERLVGVVTHIPELAEQMPARVSVGRSDRGATLAVS
jgi:exonuclease SbcC